MAWFLGTPSGVLANIVAMDAADDDSAWRFFLFGALVFVLIIPEPVLGVLT